jgi:hypothetical protein
MPLAGVVSASPLTSPERTVPDPELDGDYAYRVETKPTLIRVSLSLLNVEATL